MNDFYPGSLPTIQSLRDLTVTPLTSVKHLWHTSRVCNSNGQAITTLSCKLLSSMTHKSVLHCLQKLKIIMHTQYMNWLKLVQPCSQGFSLNEVKTGWQGDSPLKYDIVCHEVSLIWNGWYHATHINEIGLPKRWGNPNYLQDRMYLHPLLLPCCHVDEIEKKLVIVCIPLLE